MYFYGHPIFYEYQVYGNFDGRLKLYELYDQ